jgi:hypothetical protein
MNSYNFQAQFLSSLFNTVILMPAVIAAVNEFNGLNRKKYKRLAVSVNSINKCLDFTLESEIPIDPINYLRSSQYFSKLLSMQSGMAGYIVDGRLLVQI